MEKYIILYEQFKKKSEDFIDEFPPLEFIYDNPLFIYLSNDSIIQLLLSFVNLKRKPSQAELGGFKEFLTFYKKLRKEDNN